MSTEIKPLNQTLSGVLTFDASTTDMNIDQYKVLRYIRQFTNDSPKHLENYMKNRKVHSINPRRSKNGARINEVEEPSNSHHIISSQDLSQMNDDIIFEINLDDLNKGIIK